MWVFIHEMWCRIYMVRLEMSYLMCASSNNGEDWFEQVLLSDEQSKDSS